MSVGSIACAFLNKLFNAKFVVEFTTKSHREIRYWFVLSAQPVLKKLSLFVRNFERFSHEFALLKNS